MAARQFDLSMNAPESWKDAPRRRPSVFALATRGFTYLELLAAVGASLIIGTVLLVAMFATSDAVATINGQGTLQMELTLAANAFAQDVRLLHDLGPSDFTSVDDGHAMLALIVPSLDANGRPMTGVSDIITYDFNAATGLLRRIVSPSTNPASSRQAEDHIVARDITQVQFTPTGAPPPALGDIQMEMTGRRTEGARSFVLMLVSRAASRYWNLKN